MYKQFGTNSPELNQWLETVARAAIDVFHINAPTNSNNGSKPLISVDNKDL